jgi:polynucleotide 5'-kinase involved in rRNA processing
VAAFRICAGRAVVEAVPEPRAERVDVFDAWYGLALPVAAQILLDLEAIHASAVNLEGKGVVAFSGPSGSGKSTLAYGLSRRGHPLWADDAVAIEIQDDRPVQSLGLPFTLNLRPLSAEHLGHEIRPAGETVREGLAGRRESLRAVFVLDARSNGAAAPAVSPLRTGEALHALLPNAYRFRPELRERRRATIRRYLELVARVPVLQVSYTPRLERLPELMDSIERSAQGTLER